MEHLTVLSGVEMSSDGKSAIVEYTTHLKNPIPFTELMPRKITKNTTSDIAGFELYDDGWRLSR
ncbi:hypothetical protein KK062_29205 [Fulvivirgaceae bacterium PWU5]|uniref:Uncharacterized protein n=1 Tax=Dawidia cretensis TaxID=2782350 RepID=A0AAP2E5M9_9BACT|nr:hypothetical protein [Dawidia cretensis]MBT1712357.1 hypothetical protein [Dawidia cretensis]